MKYFHNIDKSAFQKGRYIGYANGVWHITKNSAGMWRAVFRDAPNSYPVILTHTLDQMSGKLMAHEKSAAALDRLASGSSRGKNPRKHKKNPSARHESAIEAAAKLQADFSGHEPGNVDTIRVPDNKVFTPVGKLAGVLYDTTRDGKREKYIHKFRSKSRPLLLVSSDGTELRIAGGRFRFTEAGIEDE